MTKRCKTSSFGFRHSSFVRISGFVILISLFLLGCESKPATPPPAAVVIYTSVDEPVAREILKDFTTTTGIPVDARYDTEATKSVGLAERLRAEKASPKCDVWWGNEIFLTIGLATDGCLAPYDSPSSADVPAKFRDAEKRWAANGMRVRVIACQPRYSELKPPDMSIEDMTSPAFMGKVVMARPVAGTTTGHVAALYAVWGDGKADAFFKKLHDNGIKLVGGNSIVAQSVASGQFAAGLTDNDDVEAAYPGPVRAIIPDQQVGGLGTLAIPTTIALVAGRPQSDSTKKLADYLLSKEVEQKLIAAKFMKFSVRAGPGEIRTMDLDYAKAAAIFPQATRRATALLEGREP